LPFCPKLAWIDKTDSGTLCVPEAQPLLGWQIGQRGTK